MYMPLFIIKDSNENLKNTVENAKFSTLVCGEADQVFLCIDGRLITEVSLENSVLVLLCSIFIFNICYPKGCVNTFNLLEFLYFDTCIDKCANSVKQFFTHISCRDM